MPEQKAPASSLLPVGSFEEFYSGSQATKASEPEASTTRSFNVVTPTTSAANEDKEQNGERGESGQSGETGRYNTFGAAGGSDSSWLLQSIENNQRQTSEREAGGLTAATSLGTEHPITPSPALPTSDDPAAQGASATASERRCSNCGASVMPGAFFCTECGTRIT